jgi:hypothetical protein
MLSVDEIDEDIEKCPNLLSLQYLELQYLWDQNEEWLEIEVTEEVVKSIKQKLKSGLKKLAKWRDGSIGNKLERSLKVSKMR